MGERNPWAPGGYKAGDTPANELPPPPFQRGESMLRTLMLDMNLDPALAPTLWTRLWERFKGADMTLVSGSSGGHVTEEAVPEYLRELEGRERLVALLANERGMKSEYVADLIFEFVVPHLLAAEREPCNQCGRAQDEFEAIEGRAQKAEARVAELERLVLTPAEAGALVKKADLGVGVLTGRDADLSYDALAKLRARAAQREEGNG